MFFTIYQPQCNSKLFHFENKAKDLESNLPDASELRSRDRELADERGGEVKAIDARIEAGEKATETLVNFRDALELEGDRAANRVRDNNYDVEE